MNKVSYLPRTFFKIKKDNIIKDIDIRYIKNKLKNIYFKDISMKRIINLYNNPKSYYSDNGLILRFNKYFNIKYYKLTMKISKKKYSNIYLTLINNKPTISLFFLINDIILYLNMRLNNLMGDFSYKNNIGNLYIISNMFHCNIKKKKKISIFKKNFYIKNVNENIDFKKISDKFLKKTSYYKKYKKIEKNTKNHIMDLEDLNSINQEIKEDYNKVEKEYNDDLNMINEKINEINILISNIDKRLNIL
jgi:hypothetical protein